MRGAATVKGEINLTITHPKNKMSVFRRDPKTGKMGRKATALSIWRVRRSVMRVIEAFGWPVKPVALNITVNGYKCKLVQWSTDRSAKFEVLS